MTTLALLFTLSFLVAVDLRILAALLPSISESFASPPGTIGLAMTSYTIAYGTGQLFYGPLSDRAGRIAVVRVAGIAFCCCTLLSALAESAGQFVAARLLAGFFAGAVIPLTLVHIGDTVAYERRQLVLARFSVVTAAALAFSAAIGGTVTHFVSWRLMLVGYGLVALVPVAWMWRTNPPPPRGAERQGGGFREILQDRRARLFYAAVFLEGFLFWGGMTYLGVFATGRHGFDQLTVGLLISLTGVGTIAGGLLMARLRRLLSENGLAALGGLLMGAAFLALIPRWPAGVFAAALFSMGFGYVGLHTTLQVRGTEISPASRGRAFALFGVTLFGGLGAGSALLGRLVDAGRSDAMLAVAGAGLIAVGLVTALIPARSAG